MSNFLCFLVLLLYFAEIEMVLCIISYGDGQALLDSKRDFGFTSSSTMVNNCQLCVLAYMFKQTMPWTDKKIKNQGQSKLDERMETRAFTQSLFVFLLCV